MKTKLFCFNYLSTVILSQLHVLKLHCFKDFIFPLLHQHSFFSLPDAVLLRVWQFVYVVYVCMLEFRQVPVIDFVYTGSCTHFLFDLNYRKIKINTENKIWHGKYLDEKNDIEIPIQIFCRYRICETVFK